MDLSACSYCGASVRWVITVKGKRMPLDPEPNDYGNVVIERLDASHKEHSRTLKKEEETTLPRFVAHMVTCPEWHR